MVFKQIFKPANKNPAKIRNFDRKLAKQFNFNGVNFLSIKKTMQN